MLTSLISLSDAKGFEDIQELKVSITLSLLFASGKGIRVFDETVYNLKNKGTLNILKYYDYPYLSKILFWSKVPSPEETIKRLKSPPIFSKGKPFLSLEGTILEDILRCKKYSAKDLDKIMNEVISINYKGAFIALLRNESLEVKENLFDDLLDRKNFKELSEQALTDCLISFPNKTKKQLEKILPLFEKHPDRLSFGNLFDSELSTEEILEMGYGDIVFSSDFLSFLSKYSVDFHKILLVDKNKLWEGR